MIAVPILIALVLLSGVTILALRRRHHLHINDHTDTSPRPVSWVDDPLYDTLGPVSDDWIRQHRNHRPAELS